MDSPTPVQTFLFVRCVPNIAVAIRSGVCVLGVEQGQQETPSVSLLASLFALLGYSKVLPESLMDSVTACSGSGIAFVRTYIHTHVHTTQTHCRDSSMDS